MFLQKENFIIRLESEDEEFVNSVNWNEIYKKVCDFFEFDKIINVKICFFYSENDFNFFSSKKFEGWNCAFAGQNNTIFIFAPSKFESILKRKKEDFSKIIAHELAHIVYYYCGFKKIKLLGEGIATYLSFYDREISKEAKEIDKNLHNNEGVYYRGFSLVNEIVSSGKKSELFAFLRDANKLSDEQANEKFQQLLKK